MSESEPHGEPASAHLDGSAGDPAIAGGAAHDPAGLGGAAGDPGVAGGAGRDPAAAGAAGREPAMPGGGADPAKPHAAAGAEAEFEIVDGLPVVADVRTVERAAQGTLPTVQVAAVAATGFVAGAASVVLVNRLSRRKLGRRPRGGARRAADMLPIAASRSFLVDVHVIGKPE